MIAEVNQTSNSKLLTYYYCNSCETNFCLIGMEIVCPSCLTDDLKKMVVVYMDHDPLMDEMRTKADLSAGD